MGVVAGYLLPWRRTLRRRRTEEDQSPSISKTKKKTLALQLSKTELQGGEITGRRDNFFPKELY